MSNQSPKQKAQPNVSANHSSYLEGLRGYAALLVVIGHLRVELLVTQTGWRWTYILRYFDETLAVPVFIVLSGYLLALPLAQRRPWNGAYQFMLRRTKRIYPAYLVSIMASVCLLHLCPYLWQFPTPRAPAFDDANWRNVLIHIGMGHLNKGLGMHAINPAMWSLAPEWWCYLIFAMFGVPLLSRRRYPFLAVLLSVGFVSFRLFTPLNGMIFAAFWLGVATAYISEIDRCIGLFEKVPEQLIACILCSLGLYFVVGDFDQSSPARFYGSCIAGAIIILCRARPGWLGRTLKSCFDSKFARWLGYISYSLYLVHFPLLSLFNSMAIRLLLPHPALTSTFAITMGLSSSFFSAHLMARFVEYRFVKPRTVEAAEQK